MMLFFDFEVREEVLCYTRSVVLLTAIRMATFRHCGICWAALRRRSEMQTSCCGSKLWMILVEVLCMWLVSIIICWL